MAELDHFLFFKIEFKYFIAGFALKKMNISNRQESTLFFTCLNNIIEQ